MEESDYYTVNVKNASDTVNLIVEKHDGTDWELPAPQGKSIPPGETYSSRVKKPGLLSGHWDWLYFSYDLPGHGKKYMVFYVLLPASADIINGDSISGAGPVNHIGDSTKDVPFPRGQYGVRDRVQGSMTMTLFEKDLWSACLLPHSWMDDLATVRPGVLEWPISFLKYPGSHDAGSFGSAGFSDYVIAWSWQTNDKNFYGQAMAGSRYFDLRLGHTDDPERYWPRHGLAGQTGDVLAWSEDGSNNGFKPEDTLIGEFKHFLDSQPNELIFINLTFVDTKSFDGAWKTIWNGWQEYLLAPPQRGEATPTLGSLRGQNRRLVIFSNPKEYKPKDGELEVMKYVWDASDKSIWVGSPWDANHWELSKMEPVVSATETWIEHNMQSLNKKSKVFWDAQCQLTPSFGDAYTFGQDPSFSPKELAKVALPYMREVITNRPLYKQYGNFFTMDWAGGGDSLAIAAMNLDSEGTDYKP